MEELANAIKDVLSTHANDDPAENAKRIMAKVNRRDLPQVALYLLTQECEREQRNHARHVEDAAWRGVLLRPSQALIVDPEAKAPKVVPTASFNEKLGVLFRTPFALGDGTSVTWGMATPDQHRIRIACLTKLREGIDLTISRHQKAIEIIEANQVTCLAEVDLTEDPFDTPAVLAPV